MTSQSTSHDAASQSVPPSLSSFQYMKQCQTVMDTQRTAFEAERALWDMERAEFQKKITELEASLQRTAAISASQNTLLRKKSESSLVRQSSESGPSGAVWGNRSAIGSNRGSEASAGDEIWKGSSASMRPTRTFSETSTLATSASPVAHRLPSISENIKPGRLPSIYDKTKSDRRVSIDPIPENIHKPSISSADAENMDGITFKKAAVADKSVVSSGSVSPGHSPLSRVDPTDTTPLSGARHSASRPDPYTMNAGHTPLANHGHLLLDGASDLESNMRTPIRQPKQPPQGEEPGFVDRPPKPPTERHDSYFPITQSEPQTETGDPDIALTGPLGLTNEESGDNKFLSELNSKLLAAGAESSEEHHPSPSASVDASVTSPTKEEEEQRKRASSNGEEPKLRMKPSMNFGAPLGQL